MITRDTPWSEWCGLFHERGATCEAGNGWCRSLAKDITCEEAMQCAAEDPAFRTGWAAWAIATFTGELDARLRGQLFALLRREPMLAALLYRDHREALCAVDRKRCLMAFHGRFRTDRQTLLPTVEGEIEVVDG